MGCCSSRRSTGWEGGSDGFGTPQRRAAGKSSRLRRPTWKSAEPMDASELEAKREEFWDTQPHFGGAREIWDALRAAATADQQTALVILDTAGIIRSSDDLSVCYDERGHKYELPNYVLSEPTNLQHHHRKHADTRPPQLELVGRAL
ncbi:hypothetical protein WJX84_009217 [Apatococcus fuscideae]|uniref:DC-UbP/UBTD2 N-terminal domain-containing protein n=1 Tax=Apatococcus fuscideae TaxID=2026836 RepID=A0AAW1RXC4_9CHLO